MLCRSPEPANTAAISIGIIPTFAPAGPRAKEEKLGASKMYGSDERDLCATLTQMHKVAIERARWDQNEAKQILCGYLQSDRRFDAYDHARLAERIQQCRSNGAVLDLDDPRLKGGEARPLERRY